MASRYSRLFNPQAYENWKTFARNLLTHVNPYTAAFLRRRACLGLVVTDQ